MLQHYSNRGCARFRFICLGFGFLLYAFGGPPSWAGPPEKLAGKRRPRLEDKLRTLSKGSSSKEAQQQGLAELPLDRLTPTHRELVMGVLESLSLFRELPTLAFEVDPEVHQFFLEHPEMAVSIWRAMKISKFQMTQTQPGRYNATDNAGTQGELVVLYRDRHQVLALCDGVVHSPILPGDIRAQTLLHLQMDFVKTKDDVIWSRNRLRMYVAFPSQAVEAAAKVVAPLGNIIIDRNLREVCLFVGMMSLAMSHQPGWVEHIAQSLEDVPKQRQDDLIQLTARVFVAARKRELAKQTAAGEATLEEVVRPLEPANDPQKTSP